MSKTYGNFSNRAKFAQEKNNAETHIVFHKKNIENGDLSQYLKEKLLKQKKSSLEKVTNNDNLKNSNTEMKKSVKIPTFTEKKEKNKNEFINSIKIVKRTQELQETKLKQTQFNKHTNLSLNHKLPKTIHEIEENEDLVRLLLKNPEEMTAEEKIYINGFSKEEFKRFMQFLKIKNKELKWRGNDWGSGHYFDHYINIYRKESSIEDKKYLTLKSILKQNFKNTQTEKNNKKEFFGEEEGNKEFFHEENLKGNENLPQSNLSKMNSNIQSTNNIARGLVRNEMYEQTAKTIFKELDNFKNTLLSHKNEINHKKIETQNTIIFKDLEAKSKFMQEDLTKIKNIKTETKSDLESLVENFTNSIKLSSENYSDLIEESAITNKIKSYCERMNLQTMDLVKKLDHNSFIDLEVDLENLQENLYRLKILNQTESEEFCNMLKIYYGKKIKVDYLIKILEVETGDLNYYNQILNTEENDEMQNENSDESGYDNDYDYFNTTEKYKRNGKKDFKTQDITINKVLGIRNYPAFEYLMQKKSAVCIQKCFRAYLSRKKYRFFSIRLKVMARRITRAIRNHVNKINSLKNESAAKITYLLRRNYLHKNKNRQLHFFTDKIFGKLTELPFSRKNKIQKITQIQRAFRRYKQRLMKQFFDKNTTKIDINMLKTKTCFACVLNRVSHLCRDCEDNHYCELCFMKFHSRGSKRNHSYLKISTLIEDIKKKKEQISILSGTYNEIAIIKNYLEQNNFNLYELLKLWDFNKNNTILYKHFKDALMVRGIKFDPYIRDLLINLAYRYITEDKTKKNQKFENLYVNYEALCLEFV